MALRADLQNIVDRAERLQRSPHAGVAARAIFMSLHQILVGPPRSGKTHTARQYAKELAAKGLARNDKPHMELIVPQLRDLPLKNMPGMMPNPLVDDIENNACGVFIFEEMMADDKSAIKLALSLIDENKGVVIITGRDKDIKELLGKHPELADRMPPPINVAEDPKPEETAEQTRKAIAREWHEMKILDIALGMPVKSPARPRFSRNKTPER